MNKNEQTKEKTFGELTLMQVQALAREMIRKMLIKYCADRFENPLYLNGKAADGTRKKSQQLSLLCWTKLADGTRVFPLDRILQTVRAVLYHKKMEYSPIGRDFADCLLTICKETNPAIAVETVGCSLQTVEDCETIGALLDTCRIARKFQPLGKRINGKGRSFTEAVYVRDIRVPSVNTGRKYDTPAVDKELLAALLAI